LHFGPTLTSWGTVAVRVTDSQLALDANWRSEPPRVRIQVPGFVLIESDDGRQVFPLQRL